ncbi:MAG: beta-ketoacyl-ACP synthase II [Chloroflexi bacterium]|nr:beta-ketoacyl-ACP synthase II [Chloroflexota bacterium]
MDQKRVAVTGLGLVTPVGLDVESSWQALVAGQSGADRIQAFDPTGFDTQFAAEVKSFDPLKYIDRKEARRMDRFVQFAVAASLQALQHARLSITPDIAEQVGVIIGSGIGGLATISEQLRILTEKGPGRVSPFSVPMMIVDMAAGQVSITTGAKGVNYAPVSACASGAHAIGEAFEAIRRGDALAIIAGGAEAPITPIGVASFCAARALSTRNDNPSGASRPFDAERDGFVIGEGAGILVLEAWEFAVGRGAPILAEIAGYGATADAYHITAPPEGGEGGLRAMRRAVRQAGLAPTEIDYVNAHGTSTPLNDAYETAALRSLFGDHAYRVPVSSTKSMIGHLLGAAGSVEAAICVLAMRDGILPPTINLEHSDPACDLDYVPNRARKAPIRMALTNSFGFGGHNVSLVFARPT